MILRDSEWTLDFGLGESTLVDIDIDYHEQ